MNALLFLEGPNDQLEFCMDGVFARCDKNFQGFKMFPTGIHFISYRLVGKDAEQAGEGPFITLIWDHHSTDSEVFIFLWNKNEEQFYLKGKEIVDSKILNYPHLAAYNSFMAQEINSISRWNRFVSEISTESLKRVFRDASLDSSPCLFEISAMMESHHSLLKDLPTHKQPEFKTCSNQICAMDRSPILVSLGPGCISMLLSELQISFLLLIYAQNFEGFEQWIDIVGILCQSESFALKNLSHYDEFLNILGEQLEMCPDDFFDGLFKDNKLFKLLNQLASFLPIERSTVCEFFTFIEKKFGWTFLNNPDGHDFFDPDPDNAPTIVEL